MKSTPIACALLAAAAAADSGFHHRRLHHDHEKRDVVVEWTSVWVTETVIVDEYGTTTIPPSEPTYAVSPPEASTTASTDGVFHETPTASEAIPIVQSSNVETAPVEHTPTTLVSVPTVQPSEPTTSTTTPVEATPTSTTEAAAATTATGSSSSGSSASSGKTFSGDMTYYSPGLGSCGYDDSGTDETKNIVAVASAYFTSVSSLTNYGTNQPANPLCDKTITIKGSNGKTTTATIRDSCPGCGATGIDVTQKTFSELYDLSLGKVEVTWWINE